MFWLWLIAVVVVLGVLMRAFINFDRLIKLQYARHKEEWVRDGMPSGFIWRAPENGVFSLSRNRVAVVLMFKTPGWAANEPEALEYLRTLRTSVLIWNAGVLFLIAAGLGVL